MTGTRPEEANAVLWSHVDREANVVNVWGGKSGTKNRQSRRVPISPQLGELLGRLPRKGERVLEIREPQFAVQSACARLGLPRLRRYDFRHLFATRCNESGVDVATFSKWLGHKDGGALALKVYVHPGDEHEQRSAAKVKF